MNRLGWYARRLRSMDSLELLWRIGKALGIPRERTVALDASVDWGTALAQFRLGAGRPIFLGRRRAQDIRNEHPALVADLLKAADSAAEGSFCFFGYPTVSLGQSIDWHYDPIADVHWPNVPSRRINHRQSRGDVKWIWELNRLQHLPWLAQAWLFTGDSRYCGAAFEQLDSWIEQNQPGRGIAWRGAFEAGIRSISVAIALQGFRDCPELTVERYERIVRVLAESASRCWRDRSLYSSANNHLVGEMAGLAVISLMFPELPSSPEWERSAIRALSAQAVKQILADGSNAEQAIGYQTFTVELLHLVAVLLVARDGCAPAEIVDALARSSSFLTAVVGEEDPAPRYGDDDEGFAVRLGPETVRTIRDHLGLVSAFSWGAVANGVGDDTLGAQWYRIMARLVPDEFAGEAVPRMGEKPASLFARDCGLVVVRSGRRRTTMDVGPLGYLSIAAHGHADALAITLSIDGEDLISDPGTASYYGHPRWRAAMRGTRVHATVCVDGQDQSINAGSFMWLRHARTHVHKVDLAAGVVDAEHDGYTRLAGRPVHRRWLIAPPNYRSQLVVDMITGSGHHNIRTSWPLHPSLEVQRIGLGHILSRHGSPVAQLLHAATVPLGIDNVRGDVREELGWWSDRLESRMPAWLLGTVCNEELPLVIATLITPMDGRDTNNLFVELQGDKIRTSWLEDSDVRTLEIEIRRPGQFAVGRCVRSGRSD